MLSENLLTVILTKARLLQYMSKQRTRHPPTHPTRGGKHSWRRILPRVLPMSQQHQQTVSWPHNLQQGYEGLNCRTSLAISSQFLWDCQLTTYTLSFRWLHCITAFSEVCKLWNFLQLNYSLSLSSPTHQPAFSFISSTTASLWGFFQTHMHTLSVRREEK